MSQVDRVRRLLQLLEHLQSGRTYHAQELADFCGVSRRTIFRDLKVLQDSGVPVLYDSRKQGYWIAQGLYLPPTDLTLAETLSLVILSQGFGHSDHGVPFQEAAMEAGMKLLSNLPGNLRSHIGELTSAVRVRTGPRTRLTGARRCYQMMMQAIAERRRVRLHYHSLHDRSDITTLLSPYRLTFMHRAWYAIGRSSLHRAVRTFHLGRVLHAELIDDRYDIPPRFSLERFLGNAWKFIRERGRRTEVCIRFQPLVATNVAEVAWHKTQRITWNEDDTMDFRVTVDGLKEIAWWILGYGDQAEVLEPPELRDTIARHVETMAQRYGVIFNGKRRGRTRPSRRPK